MRTPTTSSGGQREVFFMGRVQNGSLSLRESYQKVLPVVLILSKETGRGKTLLLARKVNIIFSTLVFINHLIGLFHLKGKTIRLMYLIPGI